MVAQTKVFVGSLPQGSKPEELRRLFERYGEVTECDIMNRCGFVHMSTEDEANAAIRGLQNVTFNGAVITVEKGRIKERGPRAPGGPRGGGGGGPMRGGMGMRNGMGDMPRRPGGGGPMRGPPMGGSRDSAAPYMRDSRPPMRGGDMRGPPMGGARNGGGYDSYPDDRYGNGYVADDRRGYGGMMDRGSRADIGYGGGVSGRGDMGYGGPVGGAMYPDERRGYGAIDDRAPLYPEERAPLYPDERDLIDRRGGASMRPPMGGMAPAAYDRVPPARAAPIGNGDMYSRRSPPHMRSGGGGGYPEREPYPQQYPSMGRMGGGAVPRGVRDMGMGPRRY